MSRFWIQAAAVSVLTGVGASAWAATLDIDTTPKGVQGIDWYYGNIVSNDGTISLPNTSHGGMDFWLSTPDGYDFTN
ncbi:MAG TPA: hypothetical protein VF184_04470, partial [Phycisphaeraceae bacterium]